MSPHLAGKFKNPRARYDFKGRTCSIVGVGSYLPERVLTNADLEKMVSTSDEWIFTRTGIRERRIAAADEFTSDLASKAALRAIKQAGITPEQIDLIIVATITPDMIFPATACLVQPLEEVGLAGREVVGGALVGPGVFGNPTGEIDSRGGGDRRAGAVEYEPAGVIGR